MFKSFIVSAGTALAVGLAMFFGFGVPEAEAGEPSSPPVKAVQVAPLEVGASACSQRAWPNYEPRCLFDATRPVGEVRAVRVITLDRGATQ
jgi:hypothetical protein